MKTYIIKRILFMIPTFFVISFILFIVLNLAPGKPGDAMQAGVTEKAQSDNEGTRREAYKIFKYQFNLDKPIFINTRFLLSDADVLEQVKKSVNFENRYKIAEVIKYQERIEDYSEDIVPHLIRLMNSEKEPLKFEIMQILGSNARRRIIAKYRSDIDAATMQLNREIDSENQRISSMTVKPADSAEIREEKRNLWNTWYSEIQTRYQKSFFEKTGMLLFETRFAKYWANLFRLDFGVSHMDKRPVLDTILSKIKYSLSLSVPSLVLSFMIALPLGIFSAVFRNTVIDRVTTLLVFFLYSLPTFFVASLLLFYFSDGSSFLHLFPTGGFTSLDFDDMTVLERTKDILHHIALPLFCLTYGGFAALSRYGRTALLEVINADYIRTARAKGLPEYIVILKHAARNGIIPIITLLGTILPAILGGSVVIEVIFNIPGMGTMTYNAILNRDYNIIMGFNLISIVLTLTGLVISDIMYVVADPRIKFR